MLDKSRLTPVKNIDSKEIKQFDKLAEQWWDPEGKYHSAIAFNQARLSFFIPAIQKHFNLTQQQDLVGLRVLEIGCGGGLICEALANLGASVTGIDASQTSIEVAKRHALRSKLNINYQHILAEDLPEEEVYDVVINAEVIEHVPDQKQLVMDCAKRVSPKGMLILATLNRTLYSLFSAIWVAEYILKLLPKGTHSWEKFVKPHEMDRMCQGAKMQKSMQTGMSYNPFSKVWSLVSNQSLNYAQCYIPR